MASRTTLVPSGAILSAWSDRDWCAAEGVQLDRLDHMQRLVVRTFQHAYEIFVHCGPSGEVLVRGGRFFQEFTQAKLTGSSLGGGFLKQLGIYVGLRLEFNLNGETIITAPVLSLAVEKHPAVAGRV
jgi:hypothetical protein